MMGNQREDLVADGLGGAITAAVEGLGIVMTQIPLTVVGTSVRPYQKASFW
jgi:hypothetical protein